jgi:hypothetical protein
MPFISGSDWQCYIVPVDTEKVEEVEAVTVVADPELPDL